MYTHLWSPSLPLTSGVCQLKRVVMIGADSSTVGFCSTAHDTSGSPFRGPSAEAAKALQVRDGKHMAGFNLEWKHRQRHESNTDCFCLLRQIACREMFADLKNKLCFFYPITVSNHYLSLGITHVSLISNDVEIQKKKICRVETFQKNNAHKKWKRLYTDVLLGLFCELYHSRNTSNTAWDAWSGVSD